MQKAKNILSIAVLLGTVFSGTMAFYPASVAVAQDSTAERRAILERDLALIEAEIAQQEHILNQKRQENQSLERDITILNSEIRKSELYIEARNLAIQRLSREIFSREEMVDALTAKMDREKDSLAKLLRKKNEVDAFSMVEVMLSSSNLSEFFEDLDDFDSVNSALNASFVDIRQTQEIALGEKQQLASRQATEAELKELQNREKAVVQEKKVEKAEVLTVSKGEEAQYQQVLKQKQETAAQIRAKLFELRGTGAIPFGQAYDYAKKASAITGVRPALILGVLKQESNLGANVGNCHYQGNMHPDRDVPIFLQLMTRLGYDPNTRTVSCKPGYGWGGAMGPAQFIPSTWILYEDELRSLLGHTPDPWFPGDAIVANAVLLRDNGATNHSYEAERLAALRYFAGWGGATNPSYAFYGDGVMSLAAQIQADIDVLEGN
jgi:membrane-bound lytic murein transglycosylase B